jgi:predicted patatin/cPLA2 family phospholipase
VAHLFHRFAMKRRMFDAISFAGGGNRCYWQGGFFEALSERFDLAARLAVGASAGAFAGIYSLLGLGGRVRQQVLASCGPHRRNFDLPAWRRGEPLCPVGPLYRALIADVLDAAALKALKRKTDFQIAVTRLPRGIPPRLGAALGIGAYQLEKRLLQPVHPRFGRKLGFRAEFIAVRDLATPEALADALIASSCVPPFMPVLQIGGMAAFDGGLVDNVPVAPLLPIEAAGGCTLVMLTRVYRRVPEIAGRTYVQPSRPIGVGQFDLTNPDGIRQAYELGLTDGAAFARQRGN